MANEDAVSEKHKAIFTVVVTVQADSSLLLVTVPPQPP